MPSAPVVAQVFNAGQPGSVLIYPLFDVNRQFGQGGEPSDAKTSVLKLTNNGPTTVSVHLTRVCGVPVSFGNQGLCVATDRTLTLTPEETAVRDVAAFFSIDRDNCPTGFIVAYATTANNQPIVYDHLTGSMRVFGAGTMNQRAAEMNAFAVQTAGQQTEGANVANASGGAFPVLPFDGAGYRQLPTVWRGDFEATSNDDTRFSEVTLLNVNTHAGNQNPPTLVAWDAANQDEEPFSGSIQFVCHVRVTASDETNAVQPGAGMLGGSQLRRASFGSQYGKLEFTPFDADDALVGVIAVVGLNRLAYRQLWYDNAPRTSTVFIAR